MSTTYTAIDLQPETEYTFRVTALNAVGGSAPSEQSQIIMTHKEMGEFIAEMGYSIFYPYTPC